MSVSRALLIDVGNTRVKWGTWHDGRISRTGSTTHAKLHEQGFPSLTTKLPRRVDSVLVSNVAGAEFAKRLSAVVGLHCNATVGFVSSRKKGFGVTNSYTRPRSMGVDRWVGIVGAFAEFRSALCIVDAGTAVTIDAVDESGRHLGGQIVAGLHMMANSLRQQTSDIPSAGSALLVPGTGMEMFASSTNRAIACGAFGAVCGAIERATDAMRAAGYRPRIILTGGDAARILKVLRGDCLLRPHLVLQGLAHMLDGDS